MDSFVQSLNAEGEAMSKSKTVTPVDSLPPRQFGARGIDWKQVCIDVEDEATRSDKWCAVADFNASVGTHIRQGKYPSVDPEKFEVTMQKSDTAEGKSTLYLRLRK
jgi:hypothetical protein